MWRGQWVVGNLNETLVTSLDVTYSIPGFYWLVRDGINIADNSSYRAPRTAIGTDRTGKLLMLEVDGCEPNGGFKIGNCWLELGKTNREMADLLIERGAYHAINLDGGGSSTTVENGTLINHPTDTDQWFIKQERAETTVACIV